MASFRPRSLRNGLAGAAAQLLQSLFQRWLVLLCGPWVWSGKDAPSFVVGPSLLLHALLSNICVVKISRSEYSRFIISTYSFARCLMILFISEFVPVAYSCQIILIHNFLQVLKFFSTRSLIIDQLYEFFLTKCNIIFLNKSSNEAI